MIVRQHDQLGDFLMSTPVFREIKRALPRCRISVVVTPYTAAVAENNPHIDELMVYQPKFFKWGLSGLFQFIRRIRSKYDLAMVLNTPSRSFTSDLIAFFSGAHFRLGMEPRPEGDPVKYDFLYHRTSPRPHPRINQTLENLTILQALGITPQDRREEMFLRDEEIAWAKKTLAALSMNAPVLFLPGAGKKENRWPPEYFIELGKKIRNAPLLVLWGPGQGDTGEKVLEGLSSAGAQTVRDTSIRQMAAVISLARLVVCNDTGDLHISAAAGAKTVALFGPTEPDTYLPFGDHVHYCRSADGTMKGLSIEKVLAHSAFSGVY